MRRRAAHDARDLLIREPLAGVVRGGQKPPFAAIDASTIARPSAQPDTNDSPSAGTVEPTNTTRANRSPIRRLADRDARTAVTDQDDIAQIEVLDLVDDVLYTGLLSGRHMPLLGEAGQRQRVRAVPGRPQLRHDLVPCRGPGPCACDQYEFRHGENVAQGFGNPWRSRS